MPAISQQEKDFIATANVLYGEGSKRDRDQAYAAKMGELYQKYPRSHEVASLYALSLLGSVPMGRDEAIYGKGAAIAKGILEENPNHPGALHYLIHSYDDPDHALFALEAANKYSKVAPDAAHALHMPSHIYVALGMWDEVVASNVASYAASVNRMERKSLEYSARSYHAFSWLLYGYLQKGQFDEAQKIMADMVAHVSQDDSRQARFYYIDMVGAYLTATRGWNNSWPEIVVDYDDLSIESRAQIGFIQGMRAWANEDAEALSAIIAQMESARHTAGLLVDERGLSVCGTNVASPPNQLDIDQAQVMEWQLRAQLSQLKGNLTDEETYLQKASALEGSISYSFGPPVVFKSSWEMYGEWLLDQQRLEDAEVQFERAYKRAPRRLLVLEGLLQSYQRPDKTKTADSLRQVIEQIRFVPKDAPVLSMNGRLSQ